MYHLASDHAHRRSQARFISGGRLACPRFLVAQVQVAKPGNDYENMRWDKVDVRPLQIIEQADGAVCKGRSISLGLKRTARFVTPLAPKLHRIGHES